MKFVEKSYGYIFRGMKRTVNPIKKRIMKPECIVHKFISNQALVILENDNKINTYMFIKKYFKYFIDGVVWADQDMKSSNHFYNPDKDKGLYGSSNGKNECITYYSKALEEYKKNHIENSMFYLGASCHLIQDLTVPHHANIKLLKGHKSFENWIIRNHTLYEAFMINKGGIYFNTLDEFINHNTKEAIRIYRKSAHFRNKETRFYEITSKILILAEATTAGVMDKFYNEVTIK